MKKQTNTMCWQQLREIDLVNYLESIGFSPCKIRGANHWYYSPLRDEKTPSFKVNRSLKRWYDFGIGRGGSIIDFCMEFYRVSLPEIIQLLSGHLSLPLPVVLPKEIRMQSVLQVTGVYSLSSYNLIRYLASRGILLSVAEPLLKEVRFSLYGKSYYALGFQNDKGGYEIRNRWFKGSSSPKGITTILGGSKSLSVFEGFFDLLSYLVLRPSKLWPDTDYLVLNSLSFLDPATEVMSAYETVNLFLDNDDPGQRAMNSLLQTSGSYQDYSSVYADHKDLNEFLVSKTGITVDPLKRKPP